MASLEIVQEHHDGGEVQGKRTYKSLNLDTSIAALSRDMQDGAGEDENGVVSADHRLMTRPRVQRIPESVPKTTRIRYVWLNLDLDMIDIGKRELRDLKFVAPTIKRLKLKRDEFGYGDATALYDFESLDEFHIVCPSDIVQRSACVLMSFYHGHLHKKRIILVDKANDHTMTLFEWDREAEERFEPHREKWVFR
ncbi:hypothetical protein GE21DRAFT_6588 [Neurospora crassa]|uniref:Uncharacterized protein n=1 Tax=Neurospora crassa (strain ATCC 24698 / 74-OR23-1A / CBS 708.71 / DSM 1257 / FGSC 987) TaxID=367110 RepID=A7UX88_NEUCR|nr:hypothetical protein NCU08799 [Neurospora crassa OR74A]EDO64950.2 hypothetical protein NCU08799 [Neurospora crassa OR74A]KHE88783.1 hypothetical protein GE21DRAFT_6588 [Neurospora crassa]|eukprot:XP_001728041.2 hypothetical protein NCU08799 [Neurospora crassa OR74A]